MVEPFIDQIKSALGAYDIDDDTRALMIENILVGAANDAFDAIHNPGIALEDRVVVIHDEMAKNQNYWNPDQLEAVRYVMTRLIEMRTGLEAPE